MIQLKPLREIGILLSGLALLGLAVYLDRRDDTPVFSAGYLGKRIRRIDRLARTVQDNPSAQLADVGLFGGPTLPFLFSLHPRTRPYYPAILLLWLETMLLTFGLTSVLKNSVNRPRPYIYHESWNPLVALTRNDRAAFLSGHASNATAGVVLFAGLLGSFNSRLAPYARELAVMIAVLTAVLRVRAGKHWPTDVIAGTLLGGGVAGAIVFVHAIPSGTATNSKPV